MRHLAQQNYPTCSPKMAGKGVLLLFFFACLPLMNGSDTQAATDDAEGGAVGAVKQLVTLTKALTEHTKDFSAALSALAELAGPYGEIFGTIFGLFSGSSGTISAELDAIRKLGDRMHESFDNLDRKLDQMQEEFRFHDIRNQYEQKHEKLAVLHRAWMAIGPAETRAENTIELKRLCADAYSKPLVLMEQIRGMIVENAQSGILDSSLFGQLIDTYFNRAYSAELQNIVLIDLSIGQLLTPVCDVLLEFGVAKIREDEDKGMQIYYDTHTYMAEKMNSVYNEEYMLKYAFGGRSSSCNDGGFDSSCEWRTWMQERFDGPQHSKPYRTSSGPAQHNGHHLLPNNLKIYEPLTYESDRDLYFAMRYQKWFQVRVQVHEVDTDNDDGITNFDNGLLFERAACSTPPCHCAPLSMSSTNLRFDCGDSTCDHWTANYFAVLECKGAPPLATKSCPEIQAIQGSTLVYTQGSRASGSTATVSKLCDGSLAKHTVTCMDGTWSDVVYDCLRAELAPHRSRRLIHTRSAPEQAMSLIGKRVRFRSVNYAEFYLRHLSGRGAIVRVDNQSVHEANGLFYHDSTWQIEAGLSGSGVSLRSTRFPDYYAIHKGGRIVIDSFVNSSLGLKQASFDVVEPLADGATLSFESHAYPNHFVRHSNYELLITKNDGSDLLAKDASWIAEIQHVQNVPLWTAVSFTRDYCGDQDGVSANGTLNQADCLRWCSTTGNQYCSRVAIDQAYRCISTRDCQDLSSSSSKRPSYIWLKDPLPYCPTGYTLLEGSGKCYKTFEQALSWTDAERHCEQTASGGHLAAILGRRQEYFIKSVAQAALSGAEWHGRATGSGPWIGASEKAKEGVFRWANGDPVAYTNWHHNEPRNNSPNSDEDCVHFLNERISGRPRKNATVDFLLDWNNFNCSAELPFICEADWILPAGHVSACRTGYRLLEGSNKCFKVVTEGHSWHYAESTCQQDDGHLTSVEDFREETFIRGLAHELLGYKHEWAGCWLGGTDENSPGHPRWTDDTAFTYTNWIDVDNLAMMLDTEVVHRNGSVFFLARKGVSCEDACSSVAGTACNRRILPDLPVDDVKAILGKLEPKANFRHYAEYNTEDMPAIWTDANGNELAMGFAIGDLFRGSTGCEFVRPSPYGDDSRRLCECDAASARGDNSGHCVHFTWFDKLATGQLLAHYPGWVHSDCATKLPFVCQLPSVERH